MEATFTNSDNTKIWNMTYRQTLAMVSLAAPELA